MKGHWLELGVHAGLVLGMLALAAAISWLAWIMGLWVMA